MKSILIAISLIAFASNAFADEISMCTRFEVPVNHEASNFKFKKTVGTLSPYYYRFLLDSILVKKTGNLELKASIDIFLKGGGKATVRYSEDKWERISSTSLAFIETTFEDEFETTWSSSGSKLVVDGVGQGQSAKCHDDGEYDVYFTYEKNLGPSEIKDKKLILHYGLSTADPFG
jgi:hypothetical protein